MKCYRCGVAPDSGEDVFCGNCGAPLIPTAGLLQSAAAGDQKAVTALYEMSKDTVYYTVRALARDEDTALDLMQDTYVQAFRSLGQLGDPGKFRPWVKSIAHNLALNQLRRRREVLFSELMPEEGDALPDFAEDRVENLPELRLDREETVRLVKQILSQLPEDQQIAIAMYYYENMPIRQIAAELGVSENTVKGRLHLGRKKVEGKVLELEKQGVKLYSLSPMLFLTALWRLLQQSGAPASAARVLPGVLGSVSTAAAGASGAAGAAASAGAAKTVGVGAGKAVAAAAGKTAASAAGKALAVKIAAVAAATVLVGGGVAGGVLLASRTEQTATRRSRHGSGTEPTQQTDQGLLPDKEQEEAPKWRLSRETRISGEGGPDFYKEETIYNEDGRIASVRTSSSYGDKLDIYFYDDAGNLLHILEKDKNGDFQYEEVLTYSDTESGGTLVTYSYYSNGQKMRDIHTEEYNPEGQLVETTSKNSLYDEKTRYRYNPDGTISQEETLRPVLPQRSDDEYYTAWTVIYVYDDRGNEVETKSYDQSGSMRATARWEYDAQGRPVYWVRMTGEWKTGEKTWEYDDRGRLAVYTEFTDPFHVVWHDYAGDPFKETHTCVYDENGNLSHRKIHTVYYYVDPEDYMNPDAPMTEMNSYDTEITYEYVPAEG